MFNHINYRNKYLENYLKNGYSPIIDTATPVVLTGGVFPRYDIIGIHKLTPSENVGKHHLFIDIIDKNGNRILNKKIEWGWSGQKPNEISNPVTLDKPSNEPSGNISIGIGQTIWAKILNSESDTVTNIHTRLPDEGSGNTIGHHSFYIVWLYVEDDDGVTPVEPPVEPNCEELEDFIVALQQENMELKNKINSIKMILGC